MLEKAEQHIKLNFPFLENSKLLVAVSGGVDSMVAAYILNKLSFNIALAHCNFKLRAAASDLDEQFVKDWAEANNLTCYIKQFKTEQYANTNKISIQVAARELRYQWFDILLEKYNFDYLITAHHANDNLETVLLNLTRGTGFKGLLGIPEQNGKIIRPFLTFKREAIEAFAEKHKIKWREDKSNASCKYTRNKIRHQVIPVLQSINPQLIETFNKSLIHLKEKEHIIEDKLIEIKKNLFKSEKNNSYSIDINKILKLNNPKAYLYELLKDFGFTAWNDIIDLLHSQTGKQVLSKTHRLIKNRNVLLIAPLNEELFDVKNYTINNFNDRIEIDDFVLNLEELNKKSFNKTRDQKIVFVDKEKIKIPLKVRKWQKGDYFYPLGMRGKKKLSDFLKDQKISLLDKEKIWVLCDDQEIIWIIGQRLDNRYKITENTTKILKINIQ